MHFRKLVILASVVSLLTSLALSQAQPSETDADKAKKKKELEERVVQMLDQAVDDANAIRLPQNRAIIYGISGDLYWKYDQKRARELFRSAANEINNYNFEAEKDRRESTDQNPMEFMDPMDPRMDVLNLIAKHDAELALEVLVATRPARIAEAMARSTTIDSFSVDPDRIRASQEISLEQRFATMAADQDPDKAIKMIKESLNRGVSPGVVQMLAKLHTLDEKKAGELGSDVMRRVIDADLSKNQDEMRAALSFLQFGARPAPTAANTPKFFTFSDVQLKELANKLATTFLQPSRSMNMGMNLTSVLPVLEKFVPEKALLLKQREAENRKNLPTEMRASQDRNRLFSSNATPEEILAEISKMNAAERTPYYQNLTQKISQIQDEARAKRLIDSIPDAVARNNANDQYQANRINLVAARGAFEEARRLIGTLSSKKMQVQRLVALATQVHRKGGEKDLENAKSLMADARALIKDYAEDEDELADLMEVVKGYAMVDSDVALRLFEPVIDQFNEIIQAHAVLSKYDKRNRAFKKGELVMRANTNMGSGVLVFRYIPQMQLLGKADLDRMSVLTDRFSRSDTRSIVRLFVLQGFLTEERKPAPPAAAPASPAAPVIKKP
ncbi:MAG: hypothetical protein ABR530_09975 [Pyrinomonadaceae bacterium]